MEGYWQSEQFSTVGILNHLKTVKLHWFEGSDTELDLVRYLVENANILEKIYIIYSDTLKLYDAGQASIVEKLMQLNKASPCATYHFVNDATNAGQNMSQGTLKQLMILRTEGLEESD
ncbi:hypothetical protein AQUCO_02600348v1 [Aquilegia coerulea]|uniref:FBD domain-containing protein n=1 Tax=Aquilegia coerulea TaxID=218851 RepID=A0A2G5D8I8_AQUCA|nr:hypothetical protein AQUCO_02600348v1 [Aquilegia coerulea]